MSPNAPSWRPRAVLYELPRELDVIIEAPRGTFIKRRSDGRLDFVSPLPCPYNYGSAPERIGGDGDPLDVVVLGPRAVKGQQVRVPVRGVVGFIDAGAVDHKIICADAEVAASQVGLRAFFATYARAKQVLNALRGQRGETRYLGLYME